MEFLIGRILEDAAINLGLREVAAEALAGLGQDFAAIAGDEPDAALGNGGLGRLAACYMESMATLGCPAYGYGIRYEHGLFRQDFDGGRQIERAENWLAQRFPWEFERPESAYTIGFKGEVGTRGGRTRWQPGETVLASAHDTPVIGWRGRWANTLRLWGARPTTLFDLDRFNRGDFAAAAEPETLARTISRVLYPEDTTYQGKELRLKQEYFLTSAAIQDILRRFLENHSDPASLRPPRDGLRPGGGHRPRLPWLHQPHASARGAGTMVHLAHGQCPATPHADHRADRRGPPQGASETPA
jgi:starch phosphorylase